MIQQSPIRKTCQHKSVCEHNATWGLYSWQHGETDVDLDRPLRVYCGQHKPRLGWTQILRNVKIRREVARTLKEAYL